MIAEFWRSLPPAVFHRLLRLRAKVSPPPRAVAKYGKPSPGGVAIDVGPMVGEWSVAVSDTASRVIAIDPDERNVARLRGYGIGNLQVIHGAAWHENGKVTIEIQEDTSESAISDIGSDASWNKKQTVDALTLNALIEFLDIDVDYLKIDAEGAEPEVLEGLWPNEPTTIVIDVSNERDGQSTEKAVTYQLTTHGYRVEAYSDRNGVPVVRGVIQP